MHEKTKVGYEKHHIGSIMAAFHSECLHKLTENRMARTWNIVPLKQFVSNHLIMLGSQIFISETPERMRSFCVDSNIVLFILFSPSIINHVLFIWTHINGFLHCSNICGPYVSHHLFIYTYYLQKNKIKDIETLTQKVTFDKTIIFSVQILVES